MKFKKGDKVTIKKSSEYFGEIRQLPAKVIGIIKGIENIGGVDWFDVKWNGGFNSYQKEDLNFYKKSNNPDN